MRWLSVQLLDKWMENGLGATKISNMMRPFMGYGMPNFTIRYICQLNLRLSYM